MWSHNACAFFHSKPSFAPTFKNHVHWHLLYLFGCYITPFQHLGLWVDYIFTRMKEMKLPNFVHFSYIKQISSYWSILTPLTYFWQPRDFLDDGRHQSTFYSSFINQFPLFRLFQSIVNNAFHRLVRWIWNITSKQFSINLRLLRSIFHRRTLMTEWSHSSNFSYQYCPVRGTFGGCKPHS